MLQDIDLFKEISHGMGLCLENAVALFSDANILAETGRSRSAEILTALAEEEAAKVAILMDAVRAPRNLLGGQLGRFNSHVAKGLYAKAYEWRTWTVGELLGYLNHERQELYLDGPNGVDWIFPNDVKNRREQRLYVDYTVTDDGHHWTSPSVFEDPQFDRVFEPRVLEWARAMNRTGMFTAHALDLIAGMWRPVIASEMSGGDRSTINVLTLECVARENKASPDPELTSFLSTRWQFPMHSFDLGLIDVRADDLRKKRDEWGPY
jgi:AbiV family abortive infection protein